MLLLPSALLPPNWKAAMGSVRSVHVTGSVQLWLGQARAIGCLERPVSDLCLVLCHVRLTRTSLLDVLSFFGLGQAF
jgi:hypothetical protein